MAKKITRRRTTTRRNRRANSEKYISKIFRLNQNQFTLDFVDINIDRDTPLFIDPQFISQRTDQWSLNAIQTIRSFFQTLIDYIREEDLDSARSLFTYNKDRFIERCKNSYKDDHGLIIPLIDTDFVSALEQLALGFNDVMEETIRDLKRKIQMG